MVQYSIVHGSRRWINFLLHKVSKLPPLTQIVTHKLETTHVIGARDKIPGAHVKNNFKFQQSKTIRPLEKFQTFFHKNIVQHVSNDCNSTQPARV